MKIVGINGSPTKNGNNSFLLSKALSSAEENGAIVENIFLADYNIEYCKGCLKCMELGKCVIKDDFEMIKKKLYNSDGAIFASPSYGVKPTARMKNFLTDRLGMFTVYTSGLRGKYFAGISTAGAIGADKVAKEMAKEFTCGLFGKAYCSGIVAVKLSNSKFEMTDVKDQPKAIKKAENLGRKMVSDFQKKRKYPLQNLFKNLFTRYIISKILVKNVLKNRDKMMKAVYSRLVDDKLITPVTI